MREVEQVVAVVVTYNRKELLRSCLEAMARQSRAPDHILVVDNDSTDGTREWLPQWLRQNLSHASALLLNDNAGGAGGFAEGVRLAIELGAHWIWMMDDDAEPHSDALERLLEVSTDPGSVYGSLAVKGEDTSWATTLTDGGKRVVGKAAEVPVSARVESLPFLGFVIHRNLVDSIGLPDAGFFIAADDVEYCMRAREAGADIIIAGRSRIEHPKSDHYLLRLPFRRFVCLRLAPWKRYYDTRNRVLIARKYYGLSLITKTIPGLFLRLIASLIYEPDRWAQTRAFFAGLIDGLLGRKGRRHERWGISV